MRVFFLAVFAAGACFAQPTVAPGGIVNHFSYARAGLPNANIARGSIFDIYGSNLGPAQLAQFAGFPIPTIIAGTSVQVTVADTPVDVYLFFVSAGQIVGVLPSRTPLGKGTLTVTVNGEKSPPAPITVVDRSIGILTLNQAGHGAAVMQMPDSIGGAPLNSPAATARPLSVGVFYGTGAGAVTFDESNAAPVQDLGNDIRAFVGGKEARMTFKGRTPGFVGLDQFNVEIPAGLSGCYVPVAFRTGDILSNYMTISVAESGACPDPIDPNPFPSSGSATAGEISLRRTDIKFFFGQEVIESTTDVGSSSFSKTDYSKIVPGPSAISTTIGPCTVQPFEQPGQPDNSGAISSLDAGPVINIKGPHGDKRLEKHEVDFRSLLGGGTAFPGLPTPEPLYLDPGSYTADNGAGGPDVGPFVASLTIENEFDWTEKETTTVIDRAQGLEVNWTGGNSDSMVIIGGSSTLLQSETQPKTTGVRFSCTVPNNLHRFTVSPQVLLALPASIIAESGPLGEITVTGGTGSESFNAAGLDARTIAFTKSISRLVDFR